ncbi:MAG TPA: EAL domain-containing protein, partial [Acidimicrobiales bacterium]|nr:EAL domain-containing protein [Acidimicrobiales bacterium]
LVARVHAQLRGQAAWSNRVVDMIEHRARLAVRINEIPTSNSPSAVGAAVCRVLATEPSINRAWIVRFPTGDLGAVLADSYLEPGDPRLEATIGTTFTREVRRRAESSAAWVHDEPLPGALGDRSTADASTVVAPLYRGPEHVDGAMVIQFTRPTGGPDRLNALATAIDLSPVVAAILHPSIEASEEHDATVIDLRESIGSGTFVPVSQPIVRLRDGEPVGFEALTRFEDGTRADLRFREAALLGVGAELELATMSAALDAGRGLPAEAWLSINVSSGLLHDRRIDPLLASAPRPVVLEITEHEEVQDYHAVRSAVRRMRPQPRIAVDDAGSGYASLQHILRLRPAFVKLDRAWVTGIELDPARQALIAGLHHFASQIGAELIGEGVERREECDTLAELGVTYAQGFLLGEPAPVGEPQTASRWVG